MMLDLAETLNPLLDKRKERLDAGEEDDEDVADMTLQLIFFDGEEAFAEWSDTDSIYGARYVLKLAFSLFTLNIALRHLAEKWRTTYILPHRRRLSMVPTTELDGIEHLILLDLLGAPRPVIPSYFLDTAWLFDAMISAERRLGDSGAFAYGDHTNMAPGKWQSYFRPRTKSNVNLGYIGDDHIPFLQRGISILHIIPESFPLVWHRLAVCPYLFPSFSR